MIRSVARCRGPAALLERSSGRSRPTQREACTLYLQPGGSGGGREPPRGSLHPVPGGSGGGLEAGGLTAAPFTAGGALERGRLRVASCVPIYLRI